MNTRLKLIVKYFSFLIFTFFLIIFSAQAQTESSGLKIYLPREVTIEGNTIALGQVAIIRGAEALIGKANDVALGRFSLPGQAIVLDRQAVLGRLLSSGIPAAKITLQGAEQVKIKQNSSVISGSEFVRQAKIFLDEKIPANSSEQWNPVREPAELVLAGSSSNIKYKCTLIESTVKNQQTVQVAVYSTDTRLDVRNVTFAAQYSVRTAVTTADIKAGQPLSAENVKIETRLSNQPESDDWMSPFGLVAKRSLSAGTVVNAGMVGSFEPAVVIKRNQNVVIKIEQPGFVISATGKALQDGKVDELIKVRNTDSQRIITVKIRQDLSVEPVL
jgi:flagellar basal body P-ring formation protein FlgA